VGMGDGAVSNGTSDREALLRDLSSGDEPTVLRAARAAARLGWDVAEEQVRTGCWRVLMLRGGRNWGHS
jgi:hypothetical protein